ncbi:FeoC-like transcriptional regulator [Thiosulfativibrio zosterae]|uniref:Transcriptional regulator HTH-type FeoC domain-containing protein n=1 Tax=Thiosulfativibrio zosterae TaxID=2675053 RepID=A0A6F8PKI2_9GAMM|nr:FeoC-like transcriptional regulator [Thiosulfativibrio zosterae]BBP42611.1 hypothetical protein THMIRHAT_03570 [Thiosulfativibrio zosterae]
MILLDLKNYIKQRLEVSSDDIKNRFDISEETLQALIRPLLKQGHIQKMSGASCSSGCGTGCASSSAKTLYRWTSKAHRNLLLSIEVH